MRSTEDSNHEGKKNRTVAIIAAIIGAIGTWFSGGNKTNIVNNNYYPPYDASYKNYSFLPEKDDQRNLVETLLTSGKYLVEMPYLSISSTAFMCPERRMVVTNTGTIITNGLNCFETAEITYDLQKKYSRLTAKVYLAEESKDTTCTGTYFIYNAETNELLYQSKPITAGFIPKEEDSIDISVSEVNVLRICYITDGIRGERSQIHTILADPILTQKSLVEPL